jgi:uncharacterized protein
MTDAMNRRSFLTKTTVAAGVTALASGPLGGLLARSAAAQDGTLNTSRRGRWGGDYGSLLDRGELLLPEGFRYVAFGRAGDPLPVARGGAPQGVLPRGHDGMASFATSAGMARLVRNHENRDQVSALGGTGYNPARFGGTTTTEFDTSDPSDAGRDAQRFRGHWVSIQGTSTNCAGGPTPWGSWMTCEETTEEVAGIPHGYVFDVASSSDGPVEPTPLRGMGRFVHEAIAMDPRTNITYETEDRRYSGPGTGSGFYRFVPRPGARYGTAGALEMLAVKGRPNLDLSGAAPRNGALPVEWVAIDEPDPADATANSQAVFQQGWAKGGAVFNRLEGAWYGNGSVYFISTNGGPPNPAGDPGLGQVWEYTPHGRSGGTLRLVVESTDPEVMEAPDNITVSPRGGLLACEDGSGAQFLRGITPRGEVFDFATHPGSSEFAGANWSPDGNWLFVNIQDPGTTFAITGPWSNGAL